MARQIKLNGRESSVLRTIGFGLGVPGAELRERCGMAEEELVDVLNSLLNSGFIETSSMKEVVSVSNFEGENFEVNPAFSTELRESVKRS